MKLRKNGTGLPNGSATSNLFKGHVPSTENLRTKPLSPTRRTRPGDQTLPANNSVRYDEPRNLYGVAS